MDANGKMAQPDSYNAALRRGLMDKIKMNMQKNPPQRKKTPKWLPCSGQLY